MAINLEWFNFNEGLGAQLAPSTQPDVLNYAWRDWGNRSQKLLSMAVFNPVPTEPCTVMPPKCCRCRVGAWRLLELLKLLDLPCSLLCNSDVAEHAPELVKAYLEAGAELVGHGLTNSERQVCWHIACSMSLQG